MHKLRAKFLLQERQVYAYNLLVSGNGDEPTTSHSITSNTEQCSKAMETTSEVKKCKKQQKKGVKQTGAERKKSVAVSKEMRKVLINAVEKEGKSVTEMSKLLKIPRPNAFRIIQNFRKTGKLECGARGGRRPSLILIDKQFIRNLLDEDCSLKLKDICCQINAEFYILVSRKTIERSIKAFHFSRKRVTLIPQ